MATAYDPVPDAVDFLARKSPLERHAILRILDFDGPALEVCRWAVRQRDCDVATAAMILWGTRSVREGQSPFDAAARNALIGDIAERALAGDFAGSAIAWDGKEIWSQTSPIQAPALDGIAPIDSKVAAMFAGPFAGAKTEPVQFAFFAHDYGDDDIFDSLWRVSPHYADAVDWLVGHSPATWTRVAEDLQSSHSEDLLDWMTAHADCATGERPEPPAMLIEDFEYWCWRTNIGNLVKRPREAAVAQWRQDLAWRASGPREARQAAAPNASPQEPGASAIERFVYGGRFTGGKAQVDRAWRQFCALSFGGAALFVAVGRWGTLKVGFALFLAWVAVISFYLSSVKLGDWRRILAWWALVISFTALGTVLL